MNKMTVTNKQEGAVLIIVMAIVAVTVVIATQLIELNHFSQRKTQLTLAREQAYQLILGGEELAKTSLAQGFALDNSDKVHLSQPWATTPFEYPVDGGYIKAKVYDATSCFNLNSLLIRARPSANQNNNQQNNNQQNNNRFNSDNNNSSENSKKTPGQLILTDLINTLVTDTDVSAEALTVAIIDWIDPDDEPNGIDGAEDSEYSSFDEPYRTANSLMADISELRIIKGFDAKIFERMKRYVCVLPEATIDKINVNTIPKEHPELLQALLGNVSTEQASEILSNRPEDGYQEDTFWQQVESEQQVATARRQNVSFTSDYFLIQLEASMHGAVMRMGSLLKRGNNGQPFTVVARYFGDF